MRASALPYADVTRRFFYITIGVVLAGIVANRMVHAQESAGVNAIEFERVLFNARDRHYRLREVDIIDSGFRPIGGKVADFAVAEHQRRFHFFYIERRLQEGTPFYPGHEMYFGHASTENFNEWEVHDPVMLVRPNTWEEAHVWAPCIVRRSNEFIMAYTGVNRRISQNIGLAVSADLFHWKRFDTNPISPCKDRPWSHWEPDHISSCRDPSICEHDGRYWMIYTANTKQGASCIAMNSTLDFRTWDDHGPICTGPATGYEPRLEGGHPQGALESANLVHRFGRWFLLLKTKVRQSDTRSWIIESDRPTTFAFAGRRPFWKGAFGIEIVKDRDTRSLLATFCAGHIRLGLVDWSQPDPTGRFLTSMDELKEWLPAK